MDFGALLGSAVASAIGVTAAWYALAAVGLNIQFGYGGLLNFGHVGFLAVGAYGLAITVSTFGGPFWLGLLVGLASALVFALLLGLPTLRLRAEYLAIVTIAASEMVRFVFRSSVAEPMTGGVFGRQGFAEVFYRVSPFPAGQYDLVLFEADENRLWLLLVLWALTAVAALLQWSLVRSPWGRALRAVREDEDAARSLGKNVYLLKVQALSIGGALGGLAGMLWAIQSQAITPDQFFPTVTFFVFTIVVLGGPGTVLGPIVGAVLFWFGLSLVDGLVRAGADSGWLPGVMTSGQAVGAMRFVLVGTVLATLMAKRPHGVLGDRRQMAIGGSSAR